MNRVWPMQDLDVLMSIASEIQKDVAEIPRLLQESKVMSAIDAEIESGRLFVTAQEIIRLAVFLNVAAARNIRLGETEQIPIISYPSVKPFSTSFESFPPFQFSTQMKELMGFDPGESLGEFSGSQNPCESVSELHNSQATNSGPEESEQKVPMPVCPRPCSAYLLIKLQ